MWLSRPALSKRVKIEVVTQTTAICHELPSMPAQGKTGWQAMRLTPKSQRGALRISVVLLAV